MPARITVILNAAAGGHDDTHLETLTAAFQALGCDPAIYVANGAGVTTLAGDAVRAGSEIVVAGGGDGTISSVVTALAGTEAALGILPVGTRNHFAKDLGIPLALEEAVRTIAFGHSTSVDVGEVNGRLFVNNSSVGVYPRLVLEREKLSARPGVTRWLALAIAAWNVWWSYRRLRVTVRNSEGLHREVRTPFLFVGNNEYQLDGVEFGARHDLDAGLLHVCMAPDLTRAGLALLVASALYGRLTAIEQFESALTSDLTVTATHRRLSVAFDGEVQRLPLPLAYRSRRGALRVIVPADGGS